VLRIVIAVRDEALSLWLADAIAPAKRFEVVGTAFDGATALELVCRTHPDVVVVDVDIAMPPQGGLTLVEAIAHAIPETLVVVLAGPDLEQTAQAALAAGAAGVLAKDGSAQIPADFGWWDVGKGPGPSTSSSRTAS
jgi:DNA-binding NarL/FixJ family response regulator